MKKILLTAVVFFGFGTMLFAQNKVAKKATKPVLSISTEAVQKAKDAKQIALKKEEAKRKNSTPVTDQEVLSQTKSNKKYK